MFPFIKSNKVWLGLGFSGGATHFLSNYQDIATAGNHIAGMIRVSGVVWYTNIDHGRRHEPLPLMTMEDNVLFSKHKEVRGQGYKHYENYDAIDVPYTDAIPIDYEGEMGVPKTFLDKYCPDQFEIVGLGHGNLGVELGIKPYDRALKKLNSGMRDGDLFYIEDGVPVVPYTRIVIRKKQNS